MNRRRFFLIFFHSWKNSIILVRANLKTQSAMEDYSHLEKFIKENYAAVCAVAMRFVDKDTAQDITQDVLSKFWENREKYKDIESLDDFLFIMVRNEALDYLRARKRENERYNRLEWQEAEEQTFHALVEEETNQLLVHAVNRLPAQTAHVIRLALSGYSNKEIALLVGVSINTVKTLKYGGIRKLKEYFDACNS